MRKYLPWILMILGYLCVLAEFFVGMFTGLMIPVWTLFLIGNVFVWVGTVMAIKYEIKKGMWTK